MARSQLWVNVAYGELLADAKPGTVIDKDSVLAKKWDCLLNQVETARDFWRNPYFNFTSNPLNHTWKVTFVPRDSQRRDFNVALAYQKILLEQEQLAEAQQPVVVSTNCTDASVDYETQAAALDNDGMLMLRTAFRQMVEAELVKQPVTCRKELTKALNICYKDTLAKEAFLIAAWSAYNKLRTTDRKGTITLVKPITPLQKLGKLIYDVKGNISRWSEYGRAYPKKIRAKHVESVKHAESIAQPIVPEKQPADDVSIFERYKAWSDQFDYTPLDAQLAYVWGCHPSSVAHARKQLIDTAGYTYQLLEGCWKITARHPYENMSMNAALKLLVSQVKTNRKADDKLVEFLRSKGVL